VISTAWDMKNSKWPTELDECTWIFVNLW